MWLVYALLAAALWGFEYAIVGRVLDGADFRGFACGDPDGGRGRGARDRRVYLWRAGSGCFGHIDGPRTCTTILLAIAVFTAGNLMIAISIKEGNAVLAGFIEISYPLFIILFSLMLGWGGTIRVRQ